MAPAIPDRWLSYKPIGKRVDGTRFIAFKVPLRQHVLKSVEKEVRLDGELLLRTVPNLGMIIDLTNTNRYYDPRFFEDNGLKYLKLMIPGHQTPAPHLVKKFKWHVINFLNDNKNNDKLIGVHCTHGVNRTGYLICNYMISEMGIQPSDAIRRFASARGHYIERENYLDDLNKLPVHSRHSRWNSKHSGSSSSSINYRRPSNLSCGFFARPAQSATGAQMLQNHTPPRGPMPVPITVADLLKKRNSINERQRLPQSAGHGNDAYYRPPHQSVLSFASDMPHSVPSTTSGSQYSVLSAASTVSWDYRPDWNNTHYAQRQPYIENPYERACKAEKQVNRTVINRLHDRDSSRPCVYPRRFDI